MSIAYHLFGHTGRPRAVRRDFEQAAAWLSAFQEASALARAPMTWSAEVIDQVKKRWDGHPQLPRVLGSLVAADSRLAGLMLPVTAVHGDFWFGNVLVNDGSVSGVVDWEHGAAAGCPLRDLARFALSYALYLDRHTRPGHRILGHRGLRAGGFGVGIVHALSGPGWFPRLTREFLANGLERLGVPNERWYDVALLGLAEIACQANDDSFGRSHLELLAGLRVDLSSTSS